MKILNDKSNARVESLLGARLDLLCTAQTVTYLTVTPLSFPMSTQEHGAAVSLTQVTRPCVVERGQYPRKCGPECHTSLQAAGVRGRVPQSSIPFASWYCYDAHCAII